MTCRKLTIDRSKTPEKLGTLKDISFYGSFQFQPCGGLIARSLVGIGKEFKKTKQQLQVLSNRTRPVAGSTGETTNEDIPLSSCSTANRNDCPKLQCKFHSACQLSPTASNPLLQACHSSNSAVHSVWICFENWGSKAHSVHSTAKRDYD